MTPVKVCELIGVSPSLESVEFLQPCPSRFRCHLCSVVHGGLLQARCGHGFCPTCVSSSSRSNIVSGKETSPLEIKCPIDGKVLHQKELKKEEQICDVLNLEVFCPYRRRGCKRSMPLQAIQSHVRSCGFVPLLCPCDCGLELSRRDLADHLMTKCDLRLQPCKYCEDEMPFRHQEDHFKTCAKKPIICQFCKTKTTQDKASTHEAKCPERPKICSLYAIGCKFKGTSEDLSTHEENVREHVNVLATAVIANRESLQKVIDILNDLNIQVNNMQDEIKDLQRSSFAFQDLQNNFSQMKLEIKTLNGKMEEEIKRNTIPKGLFNHSDSGRNSPSGSETGKAKQTAPPTPL